MKKMINIDFVKYENNKSDEYIRLDTTIIGIDNLISKASSAEEANALFKAKDVIYSQQWYFDVTVEAITREQYHSMAERFFDEFKENGADEETLAKCIFIGLTFGKLELMLFGSKDGGSDE